MLSVKILSIRTQPLSLPYRNPMKTATNYFAVAQGLLVEIATDAGLTGYGYADLFPRTGETVSTAQSVIQEVLTPGLVGKDPMEINTLLRWMEKQLPGHKRAKASIEIALMDLRGKNSNLPIYELLGGKARDRVIAMKMVGLKAPDEMAEECVALVENGIKALKLKIGSGYDQDRARVKKVRERVGAKIFLKVDANQAYDLALAKKMAHVLADCGVETFEQPLPADDWDGMVALTRESPVPIEADQTVRTAKDALEVIRRRAARIVNTSPQKAGGILEAKKIADLCEAAGMPCILSNVAGSQINDAAALHVIVASKAAFMPCEVSEFHRVTGDPASGLEVKDGVIAVPKRPGLGIALTS